MLTSSLDDENSRKNKRTVKSAGRADGQVMACDGLRDRCKFSGPLTERSKGKPKQMQITCGTQSKIVLSQGANQN